MSGHLGHAWSVQFYVRHSCRDCHREGTHHRAGFTAITDLSIAGTPFVAPLGQLDPGREPTAFASLQTDDPPIRAGQLLNDRQAQPEATGYRARRAFDAMEGSKHCGQLVLRNCRAPVEHTDAHASRPTARGMYGLADQFDRSRVSLSGEVPCRSLDTPYPGGIGFPVRAFAR
jgi:hypothetical protein